MATRRSNQADHRDKKSHMLTQPTQNGGNYYDIPLHERRPVQRTSIVEPPEPSEIKKTFAIYNGFQYQLMPVEIEKDAELGLVLGQIEGEQWVFIDEILPNGMIDTHGILKEGDYLIQAGVYSLVGVAITTALVLIERAYDEGRKSISFVGARQQKPDLGKNGKEPARNRQQAVYDKDRKASRARSFVEYENNEEEDDNVQGQAPHSKSTDETDDTNF